MTSKTATRRNTKNIGFSDEEHKEIVKRAKSEGVYPRQLIMILVRKK